MQALLNVGLFLMMQKKVQQSGSKFNMIKKCLVKTKLLKKSPNPIEDWGEKPKIVKPVNKKLFNYKGRQKRKTKRLMSD